MPRFASRCRCPSETVAKNDSSMKTVGWPSPDAVPVFSIPATCFSRSAHIMERRLNRQKDLTPYREPAERGLFVVSHSRCQAPHSLEWNRAGERSTFHEIRALGAWLYDQQKFPQEYIQTDGACGRENDEALVRRCPIDSGFPGAYFRSPAGTHHNHSRPGQPNGALSSLHRHSYNHCDSWSGAVWLVSPPSRRR